MNFIEINGSYVNLDNVCYIEFSFTETDEYNYKNTYIIYFHLADGKTFEWEIDDKEKYLEYIEKLLKRCDV